MIQKDISRLFLNKRFLVAVLLLISVVSFAQEKNEEISNNEAKQSREVQRDTLHYKYGLRLGFDLSGPIQAAFGSDNLLLKATVDARIYKNYFLAGEFGGEKNVYKSENLNYSTAGYFVTIGGDYNILGYTLGRNDVLAFGIRYGISRFEQTVDEYKIQNGYWNDDAFISNISTQIGYAHWANFRLSLKVEVLTNFYLGTSVGANFLFYDTSLDNFDNLYIPGFGKNRNNVSWVFHYTVMYLIPFN
ncbi:MAG: hypothetical protein KAH10_04130 [Flavobacteriales bacterium]|nr:hypothetical protein [Flavobacteriales bacterium]